MPADTHHNDRISVECIQLILMRIARLIKMLLIPASAVEPGQLLTFALLQSFFFCCSKHFPQHLCSQTISQIFPQMHMQHMHMCIHKTRQHQPSLKGQSVFCRKKLRFFISSHSSAISIPTASATFSLLSSVLIHPLKKIVSTVYFSSFSFSFLSS